MDIIRAGELGKDEINRNVMGRNRGKAVGWVWKRNRQSLKMLFWMYERDVWCNNVRIWENRSYLI